MVLCTLPRKNQQRDTINDVRQEFGRWSGQSLSRRESPADAGVAAQPEVDQTRFESELRSERCRLCHGQGKYGWLREWSDGGMPLLNEVVWAVSLALLAAVPEILVKPAQRPTARRATVPRQTDMAGQPHDFVIVGSSGLAPAQARRRSSPLAPAMPSKGDELCALVGPDALVAASRRRTSLMRLCAACVWRHSRHKSLLGLPWRHTSGISAQTRHPISCWPQADGAGEAILQGPRRRPSLLGRMRGSHAVWSFFLCSSCRDRGAVGTRSQHVVRCAIYVRKAHRQREYSTETACEQGSQWRRTESFRATKNEASRSHISRGNLDRLEVGGRCWNMRREAPPSHPSKTPAAATPRHLR